eukprot:5256082-Amphidinium_carterae.1
MDRSVLSVLFITLGVTPISAAIGVALSQKVVLEISQTIKNVIRCVIRVTTMRNQRKVKSSSACQKKKESAVNLTVVVGPADKFLL